MLVKKEQGKEKQIAKGGTVWEYELPSKTIGFATSKLNGRIPDSGFMRNNVCNEIYYVIGGSGTLFIDDKKIELKEGDVFLIEPGKNIMWWRKTSTLHCQLRRLGIRNNGRISNNRQVLSMYM